jgi:hypothetical protein
MMQVTCQLPGIGLEKEYNMTNKCCIFCADPNHTAEQCLAADKYCIIGTGSNAGTGCFRKLKPNGECPSKNITKKKDRCKPWPNRRKYQVLHSRRIKAPEMQRCQMIVAIYRYYYAPYRIKTCQLSTFPRDYGAGFLPPVPHSVQTGQSYTRVPQALASASAPSAAGSGGGDGEEASDSDDDEEESDGEPGGRGQELRECKNNDEERSLRVKWFYEACPGGVEWVPWIWHKVDVHIQVGGAPRIHASGPVRVDALVEFNHESAELASSNLMRRAKLHRTVQNGVDDQLAFEKQFGIEANASQHTRRQQLLCRAFAAEVAQTKGDPRGTATTDSWGYERTPTPARTPSLSQLSLASRPSPTGPGSLGAWGTPLTLANEPPAAKRALHNSDRKQAAKHGRANPQQTGRHQLGIQYAANTSAPVDNKGGNG